MKIIVFAFAVLFTYVELVSQSTGNVDMRKFDKNHTFLLPAPTGTTDKILGEGFDLEMKRID
ncbi:MAG: hypothetical protein ACOVSW_20185, partial [Candidatus Kapaibacteriota bacterium]